MIRTLHVVASLDPRLGGLSEAVLSLANLLNLRQGSAQIMTNKSNNNPEESRVLDESAPRINITLPNILLASLGHDAAIFAGVKSVAPDILHSHGIWKPVNYFACKAAKRLGVKSIIQTHGMLDSWSLSEKRFKKKLAMSLYQRQSLNDADLFIATCERELKSLRRVGITQPVAVIPCGVSISKIPCSEFQDRCSVKKTALFLGRLHPKKGLYDLFRAWEICRPNGWRLIVVGEGERSFVSVLKNFVSNHNLENDISFEGAHYGIAKHKYYAESDLFILPSYGENFGIAIAEALAHGIPVLTTNRTPWKILEVEGCGWCIDTGINSLVEGLRSATNVSVEQTIQMRKSAQILARHYDWSLICLRFEAAYRWVLGERAFSNDLFID
ncbi:RfaG Glycosyltransferase [Burkholderiales bacterium]|jgi:glycosyltransferase involved in cell wall biosynthesis